MSQVGRREFLLALGAASVSVSLPAFGQQERRVRRIGIFFLATAQATAAWLAAFRQGMAALNWVEGRDYTIDARYANGVMHAMRGLSAELVASQPDLLLTPSDEAVRVLAQSTKTIPIVFAVAQDPVGNAIVASLRRPGGNVTGLTSMAHDLTAKRLQLLKEALPRITHVVLLFEPDHIGSATQAKEVETTAPLLGLRVTPAEVRQIADIEPAFKRGAASGAQGYFVARGSVIHGQSQAIVDRLLHSKVPAIFESTEFVEAGGLMSYAADHPDNFRRAATYVDKILKGAKPGELPIEQPTKFELAVNLKTARTMGITIPQSFLLRATRVIE